MSPRDASWFLAGVLVTVVVTIFLFDSAEHPTTPVANTSPTQHTAQSTAAAGSLDEVTQKLATRLAQTGGSDSEWTLLAQSYDYMGRPTDAAAARSHIANVAFPGASATPSSPALDSQTLAVVASALDK